MTRVLKQLCKITGIGVLAWGVTCSSALTERSTAADANQEPDAQKLLEQAKATFSKLPEKMPGSERDTPAKIALGKKLYFETAVSVNNSQSCNSCHRLDEKLGGADDTPTSKGAEGKFGERNAPTTLNAGMQIAQFWDGRAPNLAAQAKGPVMNPVEMGMPTEDAVLKQLEQHDYLPLFKKAFPDAEHPITYDNFGEAVAAFERTLITRDRFDDFLSGKLNALNARQKRGLSLFLEIGCAECHQGALLGGDRYEKMGVVEEYANKKDLGRYDVTKKDDDKYVFKVPTLRNIAITGPYFHDGKAGSLRDAVKQMGSLQIGEDLSGEQVQMIVAFLRSLTDKDRIPPRRKAPRKQ